jgi:alcohol dehydrogenase class IV
MGATNSVARVEELARLGGFERLRDLGVPAEELYQAAADAAARPAAQANPRPASPSEIETLLKSVW